MKRKIALLIFLILALSLTFAACNQSATTPIRTRWEEETHVFNISLADFVGKDSNSFNSYNADGALANNGTHVKDIAFSGEFGNWDELRPLAVNGVYTVKIKPSGDGGSAYCDVTTTQEMCVEYLLKTDSQTGVDLTKYSELQGAVATQEQLDKFNLERHGDSVILYSYTQTAVRFENTTQKPLSSSVKVNGFYIGKVAQALTKYDIATEYDYSGKRPVAKITSDGEVSEYKFSKNSAGTFIDSNQILMYLRSLDKASTSFQNSPSVSVFNPYTQQLQTASFGMAYEYNVVLTSENKATKLNVVSATVGNNAFMMQENLPDYLSDKNLDVYSLPGGLDFKYTTVRFRVGYLAYEIDFTNAQNSSDWSKILTALTSTASAE